LERDGFEMKGNHNRSSENSDSNKKRVDSSETDQSAGTSSPKGRKTENLKLDDAQLTKLANSIINQIKKRTNLRINRFKEKYWGKFMMYAGFSSFVFIYSEHISNKFFKDNHTVGIIVAILLYFIWHFRNKKK